MQKLLAYMCHSVTYSSVGGQVYTISKRANFHYALRTSLLNSLYYNLPNRGVHGSGKSYGNGNPMGMGIMQREWE